MIKYLKIYFKGLLIPSVFIACGILLVTFLILTANFFMGKFGDDLGMIYWLLFILAIIGLIANGFVSWDKYKKLK